MQRHKIAAAHAASHALVMPVDQADAQAWVFLRTLLVYGADNRRPFAPGLAFQQSMRGQVLHGRGQ